MYLSAEYSTPSTSHNTAVIVSSFWKMIHLVTLNIALQVLWDKIIMRGEKTKLDLKSIKTK